MATRAELRRAKREFKQADVVLMHAAYLPMCIVIPGQYGNGDDFVTDTFEDALDFDTEHPHLIPVIGSGSAEYVGELAEEAGLTALIYVMQDDKHRYILMGNDEEKRMADWQEFQERNLAGHLPNGCEYYSITRDDMFVHLGLGGLPDAPLNSLG